MKTVTFTEFRRNASKFFDLVEKGVTVEVLRHGKPVAQVSPVNGGKRIPSWKSPGLRLVVPGAHIARAVIEERRSGR
jgi:antitoxin (DNA-binding transcriptional repressor) of toxin-antitoxin stability system